MAALDQLFSRLTTADGRPTMGSVTVFVANTSDLADVWANAGLSVPQANPVPADAGGLLPQIFLDPGTYDFLIEDADDNTLDEISDYEVPDLVSLGEINFPVVAKTADFTITDADYGKVFEVDASAAPGALVTVTMIGGTVGNGLPVFVVNVGATGTVRLDAGAGTFNGGGSTTTITTQNEALGLASRGAAGWRIFGHFNPPTSQADPEIVASVAANALTIAIKNGDGNDPSAASPVSLKFLDPTISLGAYSILTLTAAHSLVISSGSTLGASANVAFRLWLVAFNDGGTARLGVMNCLSGTMIYPLRPGSVASSTAEGGAGAADSAQVFYTGAAVSSKAYTVIGYLEWASGLGTPGAWASGPTTIRLFGEGVPLPGATVQIVRTESGAVATGTTVTPNDDTIPQITEGTEFLTRAITPIAAANLLRVRAQLFVAVSTTASSPVPTLALHRDAVANALVAAQNNLGAITSGVAMGLFVSHAELAGAIAATTFRARVGPAAAATITFNGAAGARLLGGVMNSYMEVEEIAA